MFVGFPLTDHPTLYALSIGYGLIVGDKSDEHNVRIGLIEMSCALDPLYSDWMLTMEGWIHIFIKIIAFF